MRLRFGLVGFCLLLLSCGVIENPRYRDTSDLEKPPTVVMAREDLGALPVTSENEPETLPGAEPSDAEPSGARESEDESVVEGDDEQPAKVKKGLGEKVVSISESQPLVLTIRQPFNEAWRTLKRAFFQSRLELTDMLHDKGQYYINYDADEFDQKYGSFFEKSMALVTNEYRRRSYILTLKAEGGESQLTVASADKSAPKKPADNEEDSEASADDEDIKQPADDADKLLRTVYFILRDELHDD